MPLVNALNRLLVRVDSTLQNERRFTSDAAHELRTPLAAVRIQAQVALASTDALEHRHALQQVLAGAERATRMVEQLLRIARLDPLAQLPDPGRLDLVRLARESAAQFADPSFPRSADVRFELADAPVRVRGDTDLLDMAMRNLIDNALRYTSAGTPVTVVARMEERRGGAGREGRRQRRGAARSCRGSASVSTAPGRRRRREAASAWRSCAASPSCTRRGWI